MNRSMNLPALQRIAMEFERENDIMDQRQEMMEGAIDDVTGLEEDEEESDEIVTQVLDEIGVKLEGDLANVPAGQQKEDQRVAQTLGEGGPDDLEARLDSLRR